MKKIKVKPAVNNIKRKINSQKKQPKTPSVILDEPPVYSVVGPSQQLPPPQAVVVPPSYGTGEMVTPLTEKIPIEDETPSPFLPDTNVRTLWRSFRSNTTMHGLKYASEINKYKLRGVIWVIALLCMGGLLIYTCVDLFNKYVQHTTISNIKMELVNELPFPAITFCNLSPYKRSAMKPDPVMDHYLLTLSRMADYTAPINYDDPAYSNLSLPLPDGWIYNVSSTIPDMFGACVDMKDAMKDCREVLTPKMTDVGLCYTFNSKEYIKQNGALLTTITGSSKSLAFYVKVDQDDYVSSDNMGAGMKIVVHDPDEEPDTDKGFFASPGFTSYASLHLTKGARPCLSTFQATFSIVICWALVYLCHACLPLKSKVYPSEYKYIPYPYQSSGGGYCLDTKDGSFTNPLEYHELYSRKACLKECKYRFLVSMCGCQAPTDNGTERICTLREYAQCYDVYSAHYTRNMTLQKACHCPMPCEFNKYIASVTTAYFPSKPNDFFFTQMGFTDMRTNFMEIRLFFDTLSYMKVEYQAEYDLEKIVATLGGQMGIFLGASLLTLSELVEFLLMAALVCCKRITNKKR